MPEKCHRSQEHRGPFFTITVVANESGPGSRLGGKERKQVRYVVGRLCRKCLRKSRVRVSGKKLIRKKRWQSSAAKVAVSPAQNAALVGG